MNKTFALAEVKSVEDDNPNGSFEAILSAPTKDRDGEVIDAKAFEPLPEHITIDVDHGLTASTTVGSGTPFYDGDLLKIRGTFASIPRAQEVRALVSEGHIRTMSVAFMGAEKEKKDGTPHITKAELLNAAFVAVPSNREAAITLAKSYEEKAGARNSATDSANLQAIHDLAVTNGAACMAKAHEADETKDAEEVLEPLDTPTDAETTKDATGASEDDAEDIELRARALALAATAAAI